MTATAARDRLAPRDRWRSVGARTRLVTMLVVGAAVWTLTGALASWTYAPVAGWDAAALVFSVWVWLVIGTMGGEATKPRSTDDHGGVSAP